jgi:hypothetical protein
MSPESEILGIRTLSRTPSRPALALFVERGTEKVPRRGANRPGRGPHLLKRSEHEND